LKEGGLPHVPAMQVDGDNKSLETTDYISSEQYPETKKRKTEEDEQQIKAAKRSKGSLIRKLCYRCHLYCLYLN
jgi:hypothetical protein